MSGDNMRLMRSGRLAGRAIKQMPLAGRTRHRSRSVANTRRRSRRPTSRRRFHRSATFSRRPAAFSQAAAVPFLALKRAGGYHLLSPADNGTPSQDAFFFITYTDFRCCQSVVKCRNISAPARRASSRRYWSKARPPSRGLLYHYFAEASIIPFTFAESRATAFISVSHGAGLARRLCQGGKNTIIDIATPRRRHLMA